MKALVLLAGAVRLLAVACSSDADVNSPPPPAPIADWTVLAKTVYGPGSPKLGYYVTVVLFGRETETEVPQDCYERARVGHVLPAQITYPAPTETPSPTIASTDDTLVDEERTAALRAAQARRLAERRAANPSICR